MMNRVAMRQPRFASRGMVTAELAAALIVVAMLSVAAVWLVGALVLQIQLVDVAGEVARQSARGDDAGVTAARADAPQGTTVVIERVDRAHRVTASNATKSLGPLPTLPLRASAVVIAESGVN